MAREFGPLTFTPQVLEAQRRFGSRKTYSALDEAGEFAGFTRAEGEFILARDGFYQASVAETGWPYVQHRGGPPGFVHILDECTLGYADLSGNRQYLSLGNLLTNDKVMLFFMDYAYQRRLKVWGRARISEDPQLLRELRPTPDAPAQRSVLIRVEATDWNCPQHITPRYTREEFLALAETLM
jgi:predicted pyridoxine 5'-phosphate oxidase superfamily flavin-nucleotide-binding protein